MYINQLSNKCLTAFSMDLLRSLGQIDHIVTSEHFGFVGLRATMKTQSLGAGVAEKHFGRNLLNEKYMYNQK